MPVEFGVAAKSPQKKKPVPQPAILLRTHPVIEGMKEWIWRVGNSHAEYSPTAVARISEILLAPKAERHHRFSPSSIGSCIRRQSFSYLGMNSDDNQDATLMYLGTWAHLRWQLVGLTMGFLSDVEVKVEHPELPLWGSIDGICPDGMGFELKTTGDSSYNWMLKHGPSKEYWEQIQAYMELGDIGEFVLVYENRNTGGLKAWMIVRSREDGKKLVERIATTLQQLQEGTLPPMLSACTQKTGFDYNYCPYKISCPDQGSMTIALAKEVDGLLRD